MVPLASNTILSPSHIVSFEKPEVKLTVGAEFESTVTVTIFEAAEATFDGQETLFNCA